MGVILDFKHCTFRTRIRIIMMKSNRYVFGKASIRFLITLILGFLIPVPVVGIIMAPFD
jgi:uncharacterized protein YqgC (DUF456 family)